jgi:multiple sugar transport system permease protein
MVISLINSFQIFPQVIVMTPDGGPAGSTMVMVERIYTHGFHYYEMGYASALSMTLFVIIFLFTMLQMKLQNRWVTYDT